MILPNLDLASDMFSYYYCCTKSSCFYGLTSLVSEEFIKADKHSSYEQLLQTLSFQETS